MRRFVFWIILILVAIFSFKIYSPVYNEFFDSDQAIHVLMAKHMSSEGFYYWGQNRLGSFVPVLGFILTKFSIEPIWAVSIVEYLLAVGIVLIISFYFLKDWILRISVIFMFLMPIIRFQEILYIGHPYTPHFFLFLLTVIISQRITNDNSPKNIFFTIVFYFLGWVSIWVSELSYFSFFPLVLIVVLKNYHKPLFKNMQFIAAILGTIIIIIAQILIKKYYKDPYFYSGPVKELSHIIDAIQSYYTHFINGILFRDTAYIVNSYMLLLTILTVFVFIYYLIHHKNYKINWLYNNYYDPAFIFLMVSIISFLVVFPSEWVRLQNYPLRYLTFSFYSFLVALLLYIEKVDNNLLKRVLAIAMLLISIVGAVSYKSRCCHYGRFHIDDEGRKKIRQINEATLIGNYWYVYEMAAYNANKIMAISDDVEPCRNAHQIPVALRRKKIYMVKNNFLPYFKDTVMQHHRVFLKTTEDSIKIGNAEIQLYKDITSEVLQKIKQELLSDSISNAVLHREAQEKNIPFDNLLQQKAQIKLNRILCEELQLRTTYHYPFILEQLKAEANAKKIPLEEAIQNRISKICDK